jgi:potassium-transporting ATPase KdpC subunit
VKSLPAEIGRSILAAFCLGVVVCAVYPILVWAFAQVVFPYQANGSFVEVGGKPVGSSLIGKQFSGPGYFHPRPSPAGQGYDAAGSGASNLGPLSGKLLGDVSARVAQYRKLNDLGPEVPVPADAVTASGSGLDPHISVANAGLQAPRAARARGMSLEAVMHLVESHTQGRQFGILGEPGVNVLMLNLSLDGATGKP